MTKLHEIIERWRLSGTLSRDDLRHLQRLASTDRNARSLLQPLYPLFARDAGELHDTALGATAAVDAVMRRVEEVSHRRQRFVAVPRLAAIIAVVGIAIVIGVLATVGARTASVAFEYHAPRATTVSLVGDFNAWAVAEYPMEDIDGDGAWTLTLKLERNRVYTYNVLIDGTLWTEDPAATAQVSDEFGGTKSVIRL